MNGRYHLLMKRFTNRMQVATNKNDFMTPFNVIENENIKMKKEIQILYFKINELIEENANFEVDAKLLKDLHKTGIIDEDRNLIIQN